MKEAREFEGVDEQDSRRGLLTSGAEVEPRRICSSDGTVD